MNTIATERGEPSPDVPPLTIPQELWGAMSPEDRGLYRRAGRLLARLIDVPVSALHELGRASGLDVEEVLLALRVLDGLDLVAIAPSGHEIVVRLVAVPDEHVLVVGPDKKRRWLFVARPLTPRENRPRPPQLTAGSTVSVADPLVSER